MTIAPVRPPEADPVLVPPPSAKPGGYVGADVLCAVAAIGSSLDLRGVLHRVLEATRSLTTADVVALDVCNPDGGPRIVLTAPASAADRADRGDTPALTTGVVAGERRYGAIALTRGPGDPSFTDADRRTLQAFAAVTGLALQRAESQAWSRRREQWLAAAASLTTQLLGGSAMSDVFQDLVGRVRQLADADIALLALPAGDGVLRVETVDAVLANALRGGHLVQHSLRSAVTVMRDGGSSVVRDDRTQPEPGLLHRIGAGAVLYVPLGPAGHALGTLVVARIGDRPGFDDEVVRLVQGFASQAAVALRLGAAAADREQLAVLGDRDRIARDLHDLVIQQLFATGMSLESVLPGLAPDAAAAVVDRAVDDLDATVRELRHTIFALNSGEQPPVVTLSAAVRAAASSARAALGFLPSVVSRDSVDALVPPAIAAQLLAVAREGLSNAARHAAASAVTLTLRADAHRVELVVDDDGHGMAPGGRRSGLANLAARAADLGGDFGVTSTPDGGTRLSWAVPIGAGPTVVPTPSAAVQAL